MKLSSICILLMLIFSTVAFGHGGKKHKKDSSKVHSESAVTEHNEQGQADSDHHHHDDHVTDAPTHTDEFPSIHPLIVHFAIVLIMVAAAFQMLNIFRGKREIDWIVTAILIVGVVAVWLASGRFHPHTHDLNDHAQSVLDQHDKWADWTKISSVIGVLIQLVNLFIFKSKRWSIAVVAAVLTFSAYSVSRAAYYGSQLVHIEGIGPQGKFLEAADDDD